MNKFGIISLSVLGTLGVSAGAVAILNSAPATKGKLNISYGETQIVGDNQIANNLKPVNPGDGNSFEDGLAERKYIEVGYKVGEDITMCLQRDGSIVNYTDVPRYKDGDVLIGFVNENGETVLFPKNGDILTPVYIPSDTMIKYTSYSDLLVGGLCGVSTTADGLGLFDLANSYSVFYDVEVSFQILGLSSSADEIIPVTEIKEGEDLYLIYLIEQTNKITSLNNLSDELHKYIFGQNYLESANFIGLESTQELLIKDYINSFKTISTDNGYYTVAGVAISPDSNKLIGKDDIGSNGTYYLVYRGNSGLISLNEMKEMGGILVCDASSEHLSLVKYSELETKTFRNIRQDSFTFNFVGYGISAESKEVIPTENLTQEYFEANNITTLYILYLESTTNKIYNTSEFVEFAQTVNYFTSMGPDMAWCPQILDVYETDITFNEKQYTFVGWAISSDSTEVVEEFTSIVDSIYAVYSDTEGNVYSFDSIGM